MRKLPRIPSRLKVMLRPSTKLNPSGLLRMHKKEEALCALFLYFPPKILVSFHRTHFLMENMGFQLQYRTNSPPRHIRN